MFILSFITSGLESWSVNHASIYENPELKVLKNIKFLGQISTYQTIYSEQIYSRLFNLADNHC